MSRATVAALLVAALAAMAAAWVFLGPSDAEGPGEEPVSLETPDTEMGEPALPEPGSDDGNHDESTRGWSVTLYYPGRDGLLHPEERRLATETLLPPEEVVDQVELVMQALLAGPRDAALRTPFPRGTDLLGVEVQLEEKIAWIDLGPRRVAREETEAVDVGETEAAAEASEEVPKTLQGGSKQELLIVYSVVSSVTLSLDAVERVGLLWNGSQGSTFAGHVDITRPLRANQRYLAQR